MRETFNIPPLEKGVYQHYKGNKYYVVGVGCETETNEWYVVYRPLQQEPGIPEMWIRPHAMFLESVEIDGKTIPRFRHLAEGVGE